MRMYWWYPISQRFSPSESPEKNLAERSSEGGLVLFWKYGVSLIYRNPRILWLTAILLNSCIFKHRQEATHSHVDRKLPNYPLAIKCVIKEVCHHLEHVVDVDRQCKTYVVVRTIVGGSGHHWAHWGGALQCGLVDRAEQVLLIQGGKAESLQEPEDRGALKLLNSMNLSTDTK